MVARRSSQVSKASTATTRSRYPSGLFHFVSRCVPPLSLGRSIFANYQVNHYYDNIIKVSAVNSVDPVSNAITELQFGVWGVCVSSILNGVEVQEACYGPQLGYTVPTSILSVVGLSSKLANVAETTLLTILVLHLVSAALSTVAFVLSLLHRSHLITTITFLVAIITAIVSTIAFAANVALVFGVKDNIDSLFPGTDFVVTFGNGLWMVLAAVVLAWIAIIILSAQRYYRCVVSRRSKPKVPRSGISEKDSMEKVLV